MVAISEAFVLAAGLGLRMRPLSALHPKPLIELAGRPLIDHALDRLAEAGVETAVVNVHYLADQIEQHLQSQTRLGIVISDERDLLLDTGGGVAKVLGQLSGEPLFTINTDAVWIEGSEPALAALARRFDAEAMDCLMLVAGTVDAIGYSGRGDFTMDESGLLERRGERPVAPFVFAGATIVHPRLFAGAPDGPFSMNLLWDRALEAGRLYGLRHEGVWMHVGTPESLAAAEAMISGRTLP